MKNRLIHSAQAGLRVASKAELSAGERYKASMLSLYARPDVMFERGQGSYMFDSDSRPYLDFTAGIATNGLGHCHPVVVESIKRRAEGLLHTSNLYHTAPALDLAETLLDSLRKVDSEHWRDGKVYLCNSGAEAIEAAIKFARKARASRHKLISFKGAFHGRTIGALSATPIIKYQTPFQPLLPGFKYCQFNDLHSVDVAMDEDTCGVLVEPIQGEGGINVSSPEFLAGLRSKCDSMDSLLILDEIQCGLGRTGKLWAHTNYGVNPDIMTIAKPLANGLPIGAVLMTGRVAEKIAIGDHGSTFGGNPFVTGVAKDVFDVLQSRDTLSHVQEMSELLFHELSNLQLKYPTLVLKVRGMGLLIGLQFPTDMSAAVVKGALDQSLLLVAAANDTVRFIPALTVNREECLEAVQKLHVVLETISSK